MSALDNGCRTEYHEAVSGWLARLPTRSGCTPPAERAGWTTIEPPERHGCDAWPEEVFLSGNTCRHRRARWDNMTINDQTRPRDDHAKTILVVDDEPDIVTYLTVVLRDHGYQVRCAQTADEAMNDILTVKPDLLSLDVMMPKRSGIAFYRALKSDAETRDIPVIFISAFTVAQNFTGPEFRKYVPDLDIPEPEAYLEKPVDIPKLLEIVNNVIG